MGSDRYARRPPRAFRPLRTRRAGRLPSARASRSTWRTATVARPTSPGSGRPRPRSPSSTARRRPPSSARGSSPPRTPSPRTSSRFVAPLGRDVGCGGVRGRGVRRGGRVRHLGRDAAPLADRRAFRDQCASRSARRGTSTCKARRVSSSLPRRAMRCSPSRCRRRRRAGRTRRGLRARRCNRRVCSRAGS